MRLTRFTDVAVRVLMLLAVKEDKVPPTTREVAATVLVPYSHAAKVVARLQRLGMIDARRGRGGGLALTGAGRFASIGRLMRELEGQDRVAECESGVPCPLRSNCRLRSVLREAEEAFYASMDALTVNDLVSSPTGPLLLGLSGRPTPG